VVVVAFAVLAVLAHGDDLCAAVPCGRFGLCVAGRKDGHSAKWGAVFFGRLCFLGASLRGCATRLVCSLLKSDHPTQLWLAFRYGWIKQQ
jgi:hypothetical protein